MIRYYRLTDKQNLNRIVKAEGRKQYIFNEKKQQWVRSGIMIHYFSDESDTYEMFEEITEAEALSQLKVTENV